MRKDNEDFITNLFRSNTELFLDNGSCESKRFVKKDLVLSKEPINFSSLIDNNAHKLTFDLIEYYNKLEIELVRSVIRNHLGHEPSEQEFSPEHITAVMYMSDFNNYTLMYDREILGKVSKTYSSISFIKAEKDIPSVEQIVASTNV